MLVLSRKCGEEIVVGENIHITVLGVHRGHVRLGMTAPREVAIRRTELDASTGARPAIGGRVDDAGRR